MNKLELKYQATKKLERLERKVVWLLPRWLIRWAVVRATLHATNGKWGKTVVPKITALEVMERWEESNEK
jgi:hypothetical protein